jgi:hypothetical protein
MPTATIQTEVDVTVSDEALEDLALTLGLFSSWAPFIEVALDLEDPEEPTIVRVRAIDDEPGSHHLHLVTRAKVEQAIIKILRGEVRISLAVAQDLTSCLLEGELIGVDGVTTDAIFQIALFGEIIYG